ncbi:MAG: hypothetical protein EBZ69_04345 [Alphaproteobacteria bacterium]|nr:hypothetical protein [Alphaproteobacteria bacterium]NDC56028.1 hypothetical protein [Alphaproteobacteria bacterium]NDG04190.1 hypothetical protein [Alphaproteobacteria bacterium]
MAEADDGNLPQITDIGDLKALGPKTEVLLAHPQPEFDSVGAKAYAARFKGNGRIDLLAYFCNSGLPPRSDIVPTLKNVNHTSFARVVESGMLKNPADDKNNFVFIIERPHHKRYVKDDQFVRQPLAEDFIVKNFLTPITAALIELEMAGVGHGQIRLSNMFWKDNMPVPAEMGECIAVPSGVGQPVVYETVERGLCSPAARGYPTILDDTYALGICVAFLLLGQNPLRGIDDKTLTRMKIEKGSFNLLLANQRMSSGMLELLRALLIDDPHMRWKPTTIDQWLGGQRQTALPAEIGRRANRQLNIAGQDYIQPRPLAQALADNVAKTVELVESGELDRWIRRSLMDDQRANFLTECLTAYQENAGGQRRDDMMTTYVCMALDPLAPFVMKGMRVMPGGVGFAMAEALRANISVQPIAELLTGKAIPVWAELQGDDKPHLVPLIQSMEKMKNMIEKSIHGYGPERVIYELCPGMPCQSPLMGGHYVNSVKDFLGVLESMAKQSGKPREPMDRHIAAWLCARDRKPERLFLPFTQNDVLGQLMTMLSVYGDIQAKHGPEKVPGLCSWLLPLMEPTIQRFHNRVMREELRKALREVAEKGNLALMSKMVGDSRLIEKDTREFDAARKYFSALRKETQVLEAQIKNPDAVAIKYGRPTATYVGSIIAAAIGMMTILRGLFGG